MKCLLLAFLLAAVASHAQRTGQVKIDSLLNELPKAKEDTAKVNLLADLSESNAFINSDDQMKYAVLALELAKKLGEEKHIAKAYNNLGNANSDRDQNEEAIKNYLGAQIIREKLGMYRETIGVKINIGLAYTRQGNYDEALDYLEAALKSSRKLADSELIAYSHQNLAATKYGIARAYYSKNEKRKSQSMLSEALKEIYAAIDIHKSLNKKMALSKGYQGLGDIYLRLENYHEAEIAYNLSLTLANELGAKEIQAQDFLGIAHLYFLRKEYVKAEEECKKGLSIAEDVGNSTLILFAGAALKAIKDAASKTAH